MRRRPYQLTKTCEAWSERVCVPWSSEISSLLGRFTRRNFHLITPRGSTYSRESYFQAVEVGKIVYLKWEAAGILVRRLGNVALLRYQAELEMPSASAELSSFA